MSQAVQIDLVASEVISYAAAYNGAPTVLALAIRPADARSHAELEVSVTLTSLGEQWAEPWRQTVPVLGPEGIVWNGREFRGFTPDVPNFLRRK